MTPLIGENEDGEQVWIFVNGKDTVWTNIPVNGRDGKDGRDGDSAYESWVAEVTSPDGLENPGNGVYDKETYPKWPKDKVSLADFWMYLRGKDGSDGKDGEDGEIKVNVSDTSYVHEALPDRYNLAPVRAVVIHESASKRKYDFVNPVTGGVAYAVTAPGPVLIPNCEVTFSDALGNVYAKTSDDEGYLYLKRNELPVYHEGDPSAYENPLKPLSFKFDGKTVTDESKIARTCVVPYRIDIVMDNTSPALEGWSVVVDYNLFRIVEGKRETMPFAQYWKDGGFTLFANVRDSTIMVESGVESPFVMTNFTTGTMRGDWHERPVFDDSSVSDTYFREELESSDKKETVSVHYAMSYHNHVQEKFCYGTKVVSGSRFHLPEIRRVGGFKATELKAGENPSLSYNGKSVVTEDGFPVNVNKTNYELVLGQTSFHFIMDWDSFGQCYHDEWSFEEDGSGGTYRAKRYASLKEYVRAEYGISHYESTIGYLVNKGSLQGTEIHTSAKVSICLKNGEIVEGESMRINNVYDGFEICLSNNESLNFSDNMVKVIDVAYVSARGRFRYDKDRFPYKASCSLGKSSYEFQAIKDGVSVRYPESE